MIFNILVALLLTEKIALYDSHESNIPAVTEGEFTKIHSEKKYSVVMIYAPWCQHCQHFMPVFDQFIEESKTKMPQVQIAKIDGTTQADFAKRQQVTGYPTILLFRNEKVCKYQGERKLETLVNWTKGMIVPSTIDSASDIESKITSQPTFVVYTSGESNLRELMMDLVCQGKISAPGGVHYVSSQEVADKLKLTKGRNLFVIQSGSEPKAFEGELNEKDISLFLAFSSTPLLLQYSQADSPSIFNAAIENYLFMLLNPSQTKFDDVRETFERIAKAQYGKVRMSWIDITSEDGKMACQFFGTSDAPAAILFNSTSSLIYSEKSSNILEESMITAFIQKYLDRQLKPHRKEQPLPEKWNTGPVYHLVASNFEEVKRWGPPLFVMFFAPWCGHCKKLHPEWEKLGEEYNQVEKEKKKVTIAQVDATLNDIDGVTIEHFPTLIVFMPDGSKVIYDDNRSYEKLKEFIESDFQKVKKPEDSAEKVPSKEQPDGHEAEVKGRPDAKADVAHDEL